jgi:succinate dehydrogenase/fumarate reductase-like Fe-S protein
MKTALEKNTTILKVFRGSNRSKNNFDCFEVPYNNGTSILDALTWVRENLDESLAFRYSCINANACKECMVLVNGKTKYACTARLTREATTVEPLSNKRLIRDLVSDIVPPKEKLKIEEF